MALVTFPLRSPKRDNQVDRERFDKLSVLVRGLCQEIANEAAGLKGRYEDVMVSAGSAQAAFENEGDPAMSQKVDELTKSIIQYSDRIHLLEAQIAFLEGIEKHVAQFRAMLDD